MTARKMSMLLLGLINTLPPDQTEWTIAERQRWLQAAASIFDLIYRRPDGVADVRIVISVADAAPPEATQ